MMPRIIAFREWRVRFNPLLQGPILRSSYMNFPWLDSDVEADREPEKKVNNKNYGNLHGLHAVLVGAENDTFLHKPVLGGSGRASRESYSSFLTDYPISQLLALGAVEAYGRVVEHTDGVIRSKRMRLLALKLVEMDFPPMEDDYYVIAVTDLPEKLTKPYGPSGLVERSLDFLLPKNLRELIRRLNSFDSADQSMLFCNSKVLNDISRVFRNFKRKIVVGPFTVADIEHRLLRYYEVPRLPEYAGPWLFPWGGESDWQVPEDWLK